MFLRMMFIVALVALTLVGGSHVSAQGRGTPPEPLPPGRRTSHFRSRSAAPKASSRSRFVSSRRCRTSTASPPA